MKIKWLGHSSFILESQDGIKILTDPFDESVGYKMYSGPADIVTISHHHFDHDCLKAIQGSFQVVDSEINTKIENITIEGIGSYHDKVQGAKRGSNIIFVITIDDYRICHLGDLGHELSDEVLRRLHDIDVLLIPVGGNFTIDGKEAAVIAKAISSRIVIPMHYKTSCITFPLDGVETFVTSMKNADNIENNFIELKSRPEEFNRVKLLKYI